MRIAASVAFLIVAQCGCTNSTCDNEVAETHLSPDGLFKAVIFERSCGATTGFSTQVSILDSNEELQSEAGNLFTADDDYGAVPLNAHHLLPVELKWISANRLLLRYPDKARVFLKRSNVSGLEVDYDAF